jgi:hypothetical protein
MRIMKNEAPPATARHLIDGSSFGPEALMAIGKAFDQACAEFFRKVR